MTIPMLELSCLIGLSVSDRSVLERAFELARSGECRSMVEVKQRLRSERYQGIDENLQGPSIRRQFSKLFAEAKLARVNALG